MFHFQKYLTVVGDGFKMAEQESVVLAFPHKHIKNTSTWGTILTGG